MDFDRIRFSGHAIRRMFERGIGDADVLEVVASGEAIAEYPDDRPYPAKLLLGFAEERPLHVLIAMDPGSRACHVITVHEPDPSLWTADFKKRREPR